MDEGQLPKMLESEREETREQPEEGVNVANALLLVPSRGEKARIGRPVDVWTPERVAAVCKRYAESVFLAHAIAEVGGSVQGLRWAAQRDPSIAEQLAAAHAKGVEVLRKRMAAAVPGEADWKREAWLLERYDRVQFAPPTQKVDATLDVDASPALTVTIDTARSLARRGRP